MKQELRERAERLQAIEQRHKKADEMVSALCQGRERWTMSVPARPEHDPDLVIDASLSDIPYLLAELRSQRESTIRECAEAPKKYAESLRQRAEQVTNSAHAQHLAKQWRVAAIAVESVSADILALLTKGGDDE